MQVYPTASTTYITPAPCNVTPTQWINHKPVYALYKLTPQHNQCTISAGFGVVCIVCNVVPIGYSKGTAVNIWDEELRKQMSINDYTNACLAVLGIEK